MEVPVPRSLRIVNPPVSGRSGTLGGPTPAPKFARGYPAAANRSLFRLKKASRLATPIVRQHFTHAWNFPKAPRPWPSITAVRRASMVPTEPPRRSSGTNQWQDDSSSFDANRLWRLLSVGPCLGMEKVEEDSSTPRCRSRNRVQTPGVVEDFSDLFRQCTNIERFL